ncbi:hypothetical protein V1477_004895 [Vespula maculifrons]|uniref:Uncharacterized protein n=1 Tax=Vespula maculifrons TaxID=7453 RepID=A0ABD2CN38_VESMC
MYLLSDDNHDDDDDDNDNDDDDGDGDDDDDGDTFRYNGAICCTSNTYQSTVLVGKLKKIPKMGLFALVREWLNCYLTNVFQMRKTTSQKRQLK